MSTFVAQLTHKGQQKTVVLYSGLEKEELQQLLRSAFTITGEIVGFQSDKGVVIPLTVACRAPEVFPRQSCEVLVANELSDSAAQQRQPKPVAAQTHQQQVNAAVDQLIDEAEDAEEGQVEGDAATEAAINAILRFITELRANRVIDSSSAKALEELLFDNSSLLVAAYSVAVSAGDSEYLADIFKDIADSLASQTGRSVCEAQEEMLNTCDQLFLARKISENQLLYLRHLVLIRDELVASIYDKYQLPEGSERQMAVDLFELVTSAGRSGREEKESQGSPTAATSGSPRTVPAPPARYVVGMMLRSKEINSAEASVLIAMIKDHSNEYIEAAADLFKQDRNLEEFKDTLIRCARLEIRRREANKREQQVQVPSAKAQELRNKLQVEERKLEKREFDLDGAEAARDRDGQYGGNEESEDGSDDDDDDDDDREATLESVLANLLTSLNIENIWAEAVPPGFLLAVFTFVRDRVLSLGEGKALCDLFQSNYDLVRASWEVFTVQQDSADLADTLRRIVRDLSFDDSGDIQVSDPAGDSNASHAEQVQSTIAANEADKKRIIASKKQALEAINSAKKDLLHHSLDMMVKQNIITSQAAQSLKDRADKGYPLIDAAIDSYAADRDVAEFLETLQILANHSDAEIDSILRNASQAPAQPSPSAPPQPPASAAAQKTAPPSRMPPPPPAAAAPAPAPAHSTAASSASGESSSRIHTLEAMRDLSQILIELAKAGVVTPDKATVLLGLIRRNDSRLLAIYDVLKEVKDFNDFVDSLLRIANVELSNLRDAETKSTPAPAPASAPSPAPAPSPSRTGSAPSPKSFSQTEAVPDAQESVLSQADHEQVIRILQNADAITPAQATLLLSLIKAHDLSVKRAFLEYESAKDAHKLISSLKQIISLESDDKTAAASTTSSVRSSTGATAASSRFADFGEDDDEEDDDEEDEEEDDDEEDDEEEEEEDEEEGDEDGDDEGESENDDDTRDGLDEDDRVSIESRFMAIIQGMELSHLETAALRLAIARDDQIIRRSLEVFRVDLDEKKLADTLRVVSRHTIAQTLEDQGYGDNDQGDDDGDDSDENENSEDEEEADQGSSSSPLKRSYQEHASPSVSKSASPAKQSSHISSPSTGGSRVESKANFDDEDEEDEDEEEDDDEDEDEDEEEGSDEGTNKKDRAMTSRAARKHVFPILLSELVRESILSSSDEAILTKMFDEDSAIINGALDVYDMDNDMTDLVDTLMRAAQSAASSK